MVSALGSHRSGSGLNPGPSTKKKVVSEAGLPFNALYVVWPFMINRPGVAGAVLQTPLSLNNSLINYVSDPL